MKINSIFFIVFTAASVSSVEIDNGNNQQDHPCKRKCDIDTKPMICKYKFKLEYYQTMSKACYDCPYNVTHCTLKDCIPADGIKRPIAVVNRQLPGSAIEVCLGDKIEVEVENALFDESTSIHWHGHHQKGTPYMDGVPYVTQCPISPRSKFLYRYNADTPGTHFWHSHSAFQRGDGVFGALIVRVPLANDSFSDLFDYDLPEHTLIVTDWTHTSGLHKFVAHHHSSGDNKAENILVNGKGRFKEFEDEYGNIIFTPVDKYNVKQGSRYRFRLINAGFLNCPIQVSIDNHTIVVVSSDGSDIEPVEADSLVTYAGERFDFIVEMNQDVDNYWVRFRGLMDCDERFTSAYQVAILHYEGADEVDDPTGDVSYESTAREGLQINSLNAASGTNGTLLVPELRSLYMNYKDPRLKPEPDYKFFVSYDFYPLDNPIYHLPLHYGFNESLEKQKIYTPQLNHISMKLPPFPLMVNLKEAKNLEFCNSSTINQSECKTKVCECPHVLQIRHNAIVELILIDKGFTYDANHPFHLHGYSFRVIGMDRLGKNVTEEEVRQLDEDGLLKRNFKDAPIKDTITVPDGGYTILRWQASNPGYWLFHCHIEFHVEMGMAIVFKVGEDETYPPLPKNFPQCNNYLPPATSSSNEESFTYKVNEASDDYQLNVIALDYSTENQGRNSSTYLHAKSRAWSVNTSILMFVISFLCIVFR